MEIGQNRIVHKIENPHSSSDRDEFKILTITEIKEVKGQFDLKRKYKGYKATDGNDEFVLHWQIFPDDVTDPILKWINFRAYQIENYSYNDNDFWNDVVQYVNYFPIYSKPVWLKNDFEKIVGFCKKHRCLFYFDNEFQGCFSCHLEKLYGLKETKNKRETNYVGWF